MLFTCELQLPDDDGADVDYTIQWFDVSHNNQEITDRAGARLISLHCLINLTRLNGYV